MYDESEFDAEYIMPVTLRINTSNDALKIKREEIARCVFEYFTNPLPNLELLCFLDCADWAVLKSEYGRANRGIAIPLKSPRSLSPRWGWWPHYLKGALVIGTDTSLEAKLAFHYMIYLHGSTCEREESQIMTLAHELQHFVQYGMHREIWAANTLLMNLPQRIPGLDLRPWMIPIETQARIVAKSVAEKILGKDAVKEYTEFRIADAISVHDENDRLDWEFVQGLKSSNAYDLEGETRLIFQRYKQYANELQELLLCVKDDPDFDGIDSRILCGHSAAGGTYGEGG